MIAPLSISHDLSAPAGYKKMEDRDIYLLFSGVAGDEAGNNESAREVFSALVKSTLRYRDHLLKSKGIVVTVEDVRSALDWLVPTLRTGRLPETDNNVRLDLMKLWLDELRMIGYPSLSH